MLQRGRPQRPERAGFDFTSHVRTVCDELVAHLPELAHIDLQRVAMSCTRARKRGPYGLYASLTPMRFAGGAQVERRRGRYFTTQKLFDPHGREMLYILSFCLPRFMDLDFHAKLATILHELWHIGPRFDGDLRRHAGRCYVHTASQQSYDAAMRQLADRYLSDHGNAPHLAFLRGSLADLQRLHERVVGVRIARPKLLPITADAARQLLAETAATAGPSPQPGSIT
jgi:hypothetical protein